MKATLCEWQAGLKSNKGSGKMFCRRAAISEKRQSSANGVSLKEDETSEASVRQTDHSSVFFFSVRVHLDPVGLFTKALPKSHCRKVFQVKASIRKDFLAEFNAKVLKFCGCYSLRWWSSLLVTVSVSRAEDVLQQRSKLFKHLGKKIKLLPPCLRNLSANAALGTWRHLPSALHLMQLWSATLSDWDVIARPDACCSCCWAPQTIRNAQTGNTKAQNNIWKKSWLTASEGVKLNSRTWRDCWSGRELVKEARMLQIMLEGLRQVLLN